MKLKKGEKEPKSRFSNQAQENKETTNSMEAPPFQLKAEGESKKKGEKVVPGIKVKRNRIHLAGADKFGHWWTEIGSSESYGWWPKNQLTAGADGLWKTMTGVEGELNGQTSFGGTATKDPHHGDSAEVTFQVVSKDETKTPGEIKSEIRSFASGYAGQWRWTFEGGQNCHSFQRQLLRNSRLKKTNKTK